MNTVEQSQVNRKRTMPNFFARLCLPAMFFAVSFGAKAAITEILNATGDGSGNTLDQPLGVLWMAMAVPL